MNTVILRKHLKLLEQVLDVYDEEEKRGNEQGMEWAARYMGACVIEFRFAFEKAREDGESRRSIPFA